MMFPQGNESQPSRQAPNHVTPLQFSATSFFYSLLKLFAPKQRTQKDQTHGYWNATSKGL